MKKSFYLSISGISAFLTILINTIPLFNQKISYANEIDITIGDYGATSKKDFKINWKKIKQHNDQNKNNFWERSNINRNDFFKKNVKNLEQELIPNTFKINSLNRSLVFDNNIIGPDISWLVPNGFKWSSRYKFDTSIRGYNQDLSHRRIPKQKFLGWNNGDAVGQLYYQFHTKENYSYGINVGLRSVTKSEDGLSPIGDGTSLGFRSDYKLSNTSGFAFGAEQLIHFNGITDTGRDIYMTISKGFWKNKKEGEFPLRIATAALATGRLAEGNIRGLCSDLFDGAGTEEYHERRLCWAPVFSLANVFNQNFSTFFEYNSRFFLIGSSAAPFSKIPLRGTFAVTIADHTDNYKLYGWGDMTWTFRLSLGF